MDTKGGAVDEDVSTLDDVSPTVQLTVDVTEMSNATQNALSDTNDSQI